MGEPVRLLGIEELSASATPLRVLVDQDPRTPSLPAAALQAARTAAAASGAREAVREASVGSGLTTATAVWSLTEGN